MTDSIPPPYPPPYPPAVSGAVEDLQAALSEFAAVAETLATRESHSVEID